jgi:hypothetical protein
MRPCYPFDPDHHQAGSVASSGRCSWHGWDGRTVESCQVDAVVSFQDNDGTWQSGCAVALEELVEQGEIEPLGQGA